MWLLHLEAIGKMSAKNLVNDISAECDSVLFFESEKPECCREKGKSDYSRFLETMRLF